MIYHKLAAATSLLLLAVFSCAVTGECTDDFGPGQVNIPNASFETDPSDIWRAASGDGQGVIVWDTSVAHTGSASLKVAQTGGDGGWFQSAAGAIAVEPGDMIEAEVWARTEQATGRTYFSLDWYAGDEARGRADGGAPFGYISYRPNPIAGTHDWTRLMARAFVPEGVSSVRIGLRSEGNEGSAWFDDLAVRIVPPQELLGELDRNPVRIDPDSLRPDDYVTVKDGHLWYRGKRLRIWGAQGSLFAMTHADIDLEVARFAEHGFNAFRTLYWYPIVDDYVPGDLSAQDRLDYIFACLGQHGVFVWSDLLNGCKVRADMVDVIDDPETAEAWQAAVKEWLGDKKAQIIRVTLAATWDPRIKRIYHNYIRKVLAHRNPYNGLTYAEDPTFFTWELTNEEWWIMQILWGNHLELPAFFQKELYDRWNDWLREKYGDTTHLAEAWEGLLPGESLEQNTVLLLPLLGKTDAPGLAKVLGLDIKYEQPQYDPSDFARQRGSDVVEFLMKLHIAAKNEAAEVFKSQGRPGRGCQIVPLVYDTGYSGALLPFYMHSFADATACGTYMDMSVHDPANPTFPFASGLRSPPGLHGWMNTRRLKDKPAFVYETMIFQPQKYKVEWFYRLLAWAAIQDFDVISFHYYGHPVPFPRIKNPYGRHAIQLMSPNRTFNGALMRLDEVLMSAVRTAGEIFKRGYLRPAPHPTTVTIGSKTLWSLDGIHGGPSASRASNTVFHRGFQWVFNPEQTADTVDGVLISGEQHATEAVVKPTDQIAYRWREGIMVIDDPRAKVLVGFVPRNFEFRDGLSLRRIHVNTPEGMPFVIPGERYVGFGIVSLDGEPLDRSTKLLVSAVNTSFNSGFKLDLAKMAQDTAYAHGLARAIADRGNAPVVIGRVGLTLQADWLRGRHYRMIDYNNNVLAQGVLTRPRLTIPDDLPVYMTELSRD